ncbi:winged helix-turn-helix domain-containing protein [Micromonospora sp. NBC_00858]|uniref:winged helix-turn-helix domain-containing protein n=1 Tax=Micromonospora sp. NBC_00858 TaxID=2975979 RepID=UPI00386873F2|nr:winged helix-turn-helix domain-containing protein [Micromonospora sp. NBC_00858]
MLSPVTVLPVVPRRSSSAPEPDPQIVTVEISIVVRSGAAGIERLAEFAERVSALAAGVLHQEVSSGGPIIGIDSPSASFGDGGATPSRSSAAPQTTRPELLLRPVRRTAQLSGEPVTFTRREYDLLLHLARHPRQALTRGQLLREVWGYEMCRGARTVDVHVRRLRQKLAGRGPVITTVHGIGYRLDAIERLRVAAD